MTLSQTITVIQSATSVVLAVCVWLAVRRMNRREAQREPQKAGDHQ